ncbi:MAG: hypothetical protein ABNH21_16995 [Glaciecola sp.]|jgi:hypothetical protein
MAPKISISSLTLLLGMTLFLIDGTKLVSSEEKHGFSFDGQLEALVGGDNNVVVEEIDLSTSNNDSFFTFKTKFDLDYTFDANHSLSAAISYSDKSYSEATNFDLQTTLSTLGYKFKYDKLSFNLDYRKADAKLGGNDFMVLTQVSPAVSFFVNKQNFMRLAYTSIDKDLVNNPARDAQSNEYSVDYYFFKSGLREYFISSVKVRKEDAFNTVFDFNSYQIRLAYKRRYQLIDFDSRLTLDARYRSREFDSVLNPTIGAMRVDKRQAFRVLNEVELIENLFWNTEVAYVKNNSNLSAAEFSGAEVMSGISYEF